MPITHRNPRIGIPLESVVHRQICDWLRLTHPDVIFNSDGAGNNLSRAQAGMQKMLRSRRGFPDLQVLMPKGRYFGCFLEIKRENASVFLKSGVLSSDPHIQEQAEVLQQLVNLGYFADFAIGYDDAVKKLSWYLDLS